MTEITTTAVIVNETITTCSLLKGYGLLAWGIRVTMLVIKVLAKTKVARAR
jgi:hypothetical protein